jgi:hypothetical protein
MVLWHVNDIKVSHLDPKVVNMVLNLFEERYGKEALLTVTTRGKVHEYLGMTINFSEKGKAKFTMFDYITNMLIDRPMDMNGEAATPAPIHLFQVNKTTTDPEKHGFHHNVCCSCQREHGPSYKKPWLSYAQGCGSETQTTTRS